jgi:hypothetical protein
MVPHSGRLWPCKLERLVSDKYSRILCLNIRKLWTELFYKIGSSQSEDSIRA